jgi:hypothetical protein
LRQPVPENEKDCSYIAALLRSAAFQPPMEVVQWHFAARVVQK